VVHNGDEAQENADRFGGEIPGILAEGLARNQPAHLETQLHEDPCDGAIEPQIPNSIASGCRDQLPGEVKYAHGHITRGHHRAELHAGKLSQTKILGCHVIPPII
jgi:hypothetical protein